jgi:hypothetical protein
MYFKRFSHIIGCLKWDDVRVHYLYSVCGLWVESSLKEEPHSYVLDRGFPSIKLTGKKFVASSRCMGNFRLLGED